MRRIAYFGDLGSAGRTGGGYTFAANCLKMLQGLPVALAAFSPYSPPIDDGAPNGTTRLRVRGYGFGRASVSVEWSMKARRELGKLPRQDLYVFDQPIITPYFLPAAPSVTMFHGSNHHLRGLSLLHPRSSLAGLLWRKPVIGHVEAGYLRKKLGVPLFNSRYTLECLGRDFDIDVAPLYKYVTYLPLDVRSYERNEEVRARVRKDLRLGSEDVLVAYISNFEPRKRPELAATIARRVLARHPRARFLFAGRHAASGPLGALGKENDRCAVFDEVSPAAVREYYSAADIAISTSREESFGYFLAEGMAARLPFVAYPGGAIAEVVQEGTGYIVGGEADFAASLDALISDAKLRRALGDAACASAHSRFSIEAFRDRFTRIVNEEFALGI